MGRYYNLTRWTAGRHPAAGTVSPAIITFRPGHSLPRSLFLFGGDAPANLLAIAPRRPPLPMLVDAGTSDGVPTAATPNDIIVASATMPGGKRDGERA